MTGPRLELTWPNKDKFLLVPKDQDGKPVWVDTDHPAAAEVRISDFTESIGEVNEEDPYADNLLFIGDSLDVLRILNEVPEYRQHYRGKVKLIYIDPPFNTGQTFEHYDDWMEHSTWLSFMRDRLVLMKELLAPNGSIWVHLDDAEVHRMRCLMDEVFGPGNHLATVIWEKADSPRMDARNFSSRHDSILVYAASPGTRMNRLALRDDQQSHFRLVDSQGKRYRLVLLRKTGSNSMRSDRPTMFYPLTAPSGEQVLPIHEDGREGCWRWSPETFESRLNEIEWVEKDSGWVPYVRQYAKEDAEQPAETLWFGADVGFNRSAKSELKLLGLDAFSTPKPERLLERIVRLATSHGDIILDLFSGSGTTASVAQKMGRRWVAAEILPATVDQFTRPRLAKAVSEGEAGNAQVAIDEGRGSGFRTVEVGPSMYVDTPLGVMLADWATNGRFARAVAGQLGFEWQPDATPFCGVRGRMRLAVFDGAVGVEEARQVIASLGERERVTIVAKIILPGVEELVTELSRGSRVRKAPRDVLTDRSRMRRRPRREVAS